MLEELENWLNSKFKIIELENLKVIVSAQLGEPNKAQSIEINGNGLKARATLWENGNLILKATCLSTHQVVILQELDSCEQWQIDDKLNWWLSEIIIYEVM
ncbi:hypothetical protein ACMXYQ_07990 [Neptuniibacter sp. PT34_22]|uniref:hypothetical protein n=1 Tax=Neptuniibacter sp. PT34_22 TaxID=3398205 RepID=UPI0039F6074C